MNVEKVKGTLRRFSEHLHNVGEVKAAEAVETVLKYLTRCAINE